MVRRKRVTHQKATVEQLQTVRRAKATKELVHVQKDLIKAKADYKEQKRRKKNAAAPIEKRKALGYDSVDAGMRADMEAEKERRRAKKAARLEKEAAEGPKTKKEKSLDLMKKMDEVSFTDLFKA